jgi:hypothetical protein
MAALTDDVKAFIVQALACYDTPSQVVDAVKEEFGFVVTRPQVQAYDPTKKIGHSLSKKWRDLFEETRKQFLDDASSIPIANQTFRLRALNRMYAKAERQGNVVVAAQIIEQAAKEVGGSFTNRRELTGKDGGPIATKSAKDMTDDELAAIAGRGGARTADPS